MNLDNYICYKELTINKESKANFFFETHSTKEGTLGALNHLCGEGEIVFLDGGGNKLSSRRIDANHKELMIPPAVWHKIVSASSDFSAQLKFHCLRHRYFSKKYKLGSVHSDILYFLKYYVPENKTFRILDVGCGSGRNLLYCALLKHSITGIDHNVEAIDKIQTIAQREHLTNVSTLVHDLNLPLINLSESFDIVISTVCLQFLKPERIEPLLKELQAKTNPNGLHLLVFPITAIPYSFPPTFTYLARHDELYHFYQDNGWAVLEYKESVGQLHKLDDSGKPMQGVFGLLIAKKIA